MLPSKHIRLWPRGGRMKPPHAHKRRRTGRERAPPPTPLRRQRATTAHRRRKRTHHHPQTPPRSHPACCMLHQLSDTCPAASIRSASVRVTRVTGDPHKAASRVHQPSMHERMSGARVNVPTGGCMRCACPAHQCPSACLCHKPSMATKHKRATSHGLASMHRACHNCACPCHQPCKASKHESATSLASIGHHARCMPTMAHAFPPSLSTCPTDQSDAVPPAPRACPARGVCCPACPYQVVTF